MIFLLARTENVAGAEPPCLTELKKESKLKPFRLRKTKESLRSHESEGGERERERKRGGWFSDECGLSVYCERMKLKPEYC